MLYHVVLYYHFICDSRPLEWQDCVEHCTAPGSWSGQRRLHGQERSVSMPDSESELDSAAAYAVSECMSVHRSLYTTQPSWCSYQGVTCGSVSGSSSYASVISISIRFLGLFDILSSEIGSFGSLSSLDGRNNGISGTIPSSIGAMTSLTFINMFYNALTGSVPASIGSLVALQELNLNSNALTGSIPTSIGTLTAVGYLNLGSNRLVELYRPESVAWHH